MKTSRYSEEQIIGFLKQADAVTPIPLEALGSRDLAYDRACGNKP